MNSVPDPINEFDRIVIPFGHPTLSSSDGRTFVRRYWRSVLLCSLTALLACKVHAQSQPATSDSAAPAADVIRCLPDGSGYLRARLKGAIDTELNWGNDGTSCTGAVRPTDGGIRMRFTGQNSGSKPDQPPLVLVFGIAGLREGANAKALPVNVTIIREGTGEFYGTRGDDKCTLDEIRQTALVGIPHRNRSYRVVARGFCTEPARALTGNGVVLISRFDYVGRIDFDAEDNTDEPQIKQPPKPSSPNDGKPTL
ncbi:MAG TPA: hypothetical protein VIT67_09285 [Povalibacter sp.]